MNRAIYGIKLTHDGAVARVEDGQLTWSVEAEKLSNAARYSRLRAPDNVNIEDGLSAILKQQEATGQTPPATAMPRLVVDGWKGGRVAEGWNRAVGNYHENDQTAKQFGLEGGVLRSDEVTLLGMEYESCLHSDSHLFAAYCTAPWAAEQRAAWVLLWDGSTTPRLYHIDPARGAEAAVQFHGALINFSGKIYGIMGYYFGPFKDAAAEAQARSLLDEGVEMQLPKGPGYDVPGKLMSYIALGKADEWLVEAMRHLYAEIGGRRTLNAPTHMDNSAQFDHRFMIAVSDLLATQRTTRSDADILASVHTFLGRLLVGEILASVNSEEPLALTGGCALNIKWNSAIRDSRSGPVWVPPFCNDSGNAIGAACWAMVMHEGRWALDWSVFAGPVLWADAAWAPEGWVAERHVDVSRVAAMLHDGALVAFLNGKAECGPRALGHRSLLMRATHLESKVRLNTAKRREAWRPVAPICLESEAQRWFLPGTPDPYMLFEHEALPNATKVLPAVIHLDGTSRLQTVTFKSDPLMWALLTHYATLSGVGVLCNTSANLNGSGFFPNASSACAWGEADAVWADGTLYTRRT